jgi:hypothetical protein
MSQRYTIFPSKDNKTGVLRYFFKHENPDADKTKNGGICYGIQCYCMPNGSFLTIENAADAITVCALLNHLEKNYTVL